MKLLYTGSCKRNYCRPRYSQTRFIWNQAKTKRNISKSVVFAFLFSYILNSDKRYLTIIDRRGRKSVSLFTDTEVTTETKWVNNVSHDEGFVHLSTLFWTSCARFPSFLRKMELFGAGHPLVWYLLKTIICPNGRFSVGEE